MISTPAMADENRAEVNADIFDVCSEAWNDFEVKHQQCITTQQDAYIQYRLLERTVVVEYCERIWAPNYRKLVRCVEHANDHGPTSEDRLQAQEVLLNNSVSE